MVSYKQKLKILFEDYVNAVHEIIKKYHADPKSIDKNDLQVLFDELEGIDIDDKGIRDELEDARTDFETGNTVGSHAIETIIKLFKEEEKKKPASGVPASGVPTSGKSKSAFSLVDKYGRKALYATQIGRFADRKLGIRDASGSVDAEDDPTDIIDDPTSLKDIINNLAVLKKHYWDDKDTFIGEAYVRAHNAFRFFNGPDDVDKFIQYYKDEYIDKFNIELANAEKVCNLRKNMLKDIADKAKLYKDIIIKRTPRDE